MAAQEAAVAVIKSALLLTATLLLPTAVLSAVLPEDRADVIYHSYDGDGTAVDGPAVLVRKNVSGNVSLWGRYYQDVVSGASIDVRAAATSFTETRNEYSLGADYLYDKTTLSAGFTNSDSGDYLSDSYSFAVSHDFFGDLTTVALSFGFSDEDVFDVTDESFADEVTTQSYTFSLSQILTKNIVVGLTAQSISSEGFLNSPYRDVRFLDPGNVAGFNFEDELYPRTRNSDAVAIRYNQYLPYRASIRGEYRAYADSWGIESNTFRFDYIHPFENLTLSLNLRYYDQNTPADFYSDLFAFSEATNFRARDKELSTYSILSLGVGASYELPETWLPFLDKSSVSLFIDRLNYDYSDFRDVTVTDEGGLPLFAPGEEPLFGFDATVVRFFVSFWY